MATIEIKTLTGTEPFNIYLCDQFKSNCIYINTINGSSIPYDFDVPPIFNGQDTLFIKATDKNNCLIYFEILL